MFITESLLSLKKRRLLASLDDAALMLTASTTLTDTTTSSSYCTESTSCSDTDGSRRTLDMDAEFAAFQVTYRLSFLSRRCQ